MQTGAALHLCLWAGGNSSYHQAQIQNLRGTSHCCGPVVPRGRHINKNHMDRFFKNKNKKKQPLEKAENISFKAINVLQATNSNSQDSDSHWTHFQQIVCIDVYKANNLKPTCEQCYVAKDFLSFSSASWGQAMCCSGNIQWLNPLTYSVR